MVIPKCVGGICYLFIVVSVLLFIVTLIASQNIELLYFSTDNVLSLQSQLLISLANCFITAACAITIFNGQVLGRQVWHLWSVIYFFINAWQLQERMYLIPGAALFLVSLFFLYGKPAQAFFKEAQQSKPQGKRVDDTLNIFED